MSTETNKQIVLKMYEYQDKGDMKGERTLFAPDFVARMGGSEQAMDADQFGAMETTFVTSFANGRHVISSQVAEGDTVVTIGSWSALHVGDFNGIPASQKPVKIEFWSTDRLRDGKIVEHVALVDVMSLMVQIGAIPSQAAA